MSLFDDNLVEQLPGLDIMIRSRFEYAIRHAADEFNRSRSRIQYMLEKRENFEKILRIELCNAIGPLFVFNEEYTLGGSHIDIKFDQYPLVEIRTYFLINYIREHRAQPYNFTGYVTLYGESNPLFGDEFI